MLVDPGRIIVVVIVIVIPPLMVVVVLVWMEPGRVRVVVFVTVQLIDFDIEVKSGLIMVILVAFSSNGLACNPEGNER